MKKFIEVRSVKATQGKNVDVYSFFLKGSDVLKLQILSDTSR